jgi:acetyl esterase/lipase
MSLYITKPADWMAGDLRPAILFFHGGSWTKGKPGQFTEHSKYFASRGVVCVQVEYRLVDRKELRETPEKCINDAKSAMRWVRSKAAELGIDPNRIASGGGSAGGHLAAFIGMVDGMDDPQDDLSISAKSNAMLLFTPVFDNGPGGYGYGEIKDRYPEFSPIHNISADDPPAIVFLGDQDQLIPVETVFKFDTQMEAVGVSCEVMIFEGMKHGFFNHGKHENQPYEQTVIASDEFLSELGWLEGKPTLVEAMKQNETPETVLAGFEQRVDSIFRTESGKSLVRAKKRKPLRPGRGNYVRAYSYSIMAFAARCLYLNEMLDEANAALVENAQHYLDNPNDINDRDSFHWHAEIVMRLIEMYGTHGSKHAGLITKETETLVLKPIWEYAKKSNPNANAEFKKSETWYVYESENHHAMIFTVLWHFAKLAKDRPEYQTLEYQGQTPAEHYRDWNEYFVRYCLERARKGMFIEMMNGGYNSTLIKGIYNFYDFGDPQVRRSAGLLLDLYFAYWAQEQIDGVQGGGRSRVYFYNGLQQNRKHGMAPLAWFYFGIGKQPAVNGHDMDAALSDYRPPPVVADIALDVGGRGRYEVRQRPLGLGSGFHPYKLKTDQGGILRYSFCAPAFIMGTPMTEARPLSDWTKISAQNRWQGVIFAGEEVDARIVPIVRPADNRVAFNGFWSVQSKSSLITQKLTSHKGGAEMIVWISKEGLSAPDEEKGVVFVEADGAYAAIRVINSGFKWRDETFNKREPPARVMILNNEYALVILEVMAKSDVDSFAAFKQKVKACELRISKSVVEYTTIYGDELTLDTDYKKTPTINGKPVNYAPEKVFESPFLNAVYNRGIVTISKGARKKVLDFN